MSAICCSASLVPGIRRRSTMAVVIASTMRWVLPGSSRLRGPRARCCARAPVRRRGAMPGWMTWRLARSGMRGVGVDEQGLAAVVGIGAQGSPGLDVYSKVYTRLRRSASPNRPRPNPHRIQDASRWATSRTHVLDTAHGCPAAGMRVTLQRLGRGRPGHAASSSRSTRRPRRRPAARGADHGRGPLPAAVRGGALLPGPRRDAARAAVLDAVQLDFGIADAAGHYHVPLLVSPWSYSTYRGS